MMNDRNLVMVTSFIFVFVMILAIFLYKKRKNQSIFQEYDERQLIARSKAYSTAFFVFMILICVDAMIKLAGIHWCEDPLGEFAALFITLIVFAWKSISSDAFWGRYEVKNKKTMLICYLAIGISQLAIAIMSLDEIFMDGIVTMQAISLLSGITFLSIAAMMLIHDRHANAEDEDE